MSAPYFADHDVTLWRGDAAEVLAQLPAESVNCVVTSPPYFGLRDYGHDGQIGLEGSPAEYVAALVAVFAQVKRVLRDDGVLWLNLGDSYSSGPGLRAAQRPQTNTTRVDGEVVRTARGSFASDARDNSVRYFEDVPPQKNLLGIPWRVAFALQDDGWVLRNAAIWHKPNAMPESVTDRLSGRYENLFMLSKGPRYWFDLDPIRLPHEHAIAGQKGPGGGWAGNQSRGVPATGHRNLMGNIGGKNPGDVWSIATQPFTGAHFAVMPPELVRRCIVSGCPDGGTVLDPFSGSGTTAMVARQLGRKAVGIELNPDYLALSVGRIGDTPLDFVGASR